MNTDAPAVRAFLDAIWGHGPHALCWHTPGMRFSYTFVDTPSDVLDDIAAFERADVWIGAHPLKGRPAAGRGDVADVAEVVALPADLDWADPSRRTDAELPSEGELRHRLASLGPELRPSVVVNSGHGLQPWWLLDAPVPPEVGAELMAGLNALLADIGLHNGRPDLASIMRLPGTRNYKGAPISALFEP